MYQKWRDETIAELALEGVLYDDIRRLLSAATTMHRIAEIQCSIEISERETARLDRRDAAAAKRVRAIAARYGATVAEQGDPRGCPFALEFPARPGQPVHVVGRSLPASVYC